MAYLLYPFYKLFGSNAFALVAAVNVLHLAAIAGCVILARRLGGTSIAAFVALTLTASTMAVAPRFFLEPWNVWVPVFAFALFLVLIWGLACEHVALLTDRRRRRQPLRADPHQLHRARHRVARLDTRLARLVVVAHRPLGGASSAAVAGDRDGDDDRELAATGDRAAPSRHGKHAQAVPPVHRSRRAVRRAPGRRSRRWSVASTSSGHG